MDNLNSGTDGAEDDDLRSVLEQAMAGAAEMPAAEPEATSVEPPAADDDPIANEAAAERARDEKGRFAKAEEAAKAEAAAKAPEAEQPQQQPLEQQGQPAAPGQRPPPGWSIKSKADFDKLPEHVRADILKREDEVNRGFSKLAEYKGLDRYSEMAKASGTDLPAALERYVAAEQYLERNPVEGLLWLAQTYGVNPERLVQAMGQQSQPGAQQPVPPPQPPAFDPRMIEDHVNRALATREMDSAISEFLNDPANRYANDVADYMAGLINVRRQQNTASNTSESHRETLKWAYQQALYAHPEVREVLQREDMERRAKESQQVAQKARLASKSIVGSPTPGVAPGEPQATVRDELLAAFNSARA